MERPGCFGSRGRRVFCGRCARYSTVQYSTPVLTMLSREIQNPTIRCICYLGYRLGAVMLVVTIVTGLPVWAMEKGFQV
jgi:hypothetical protein